MNAICPPRSGYIINIYFILCTGVGYCVLKTIEAKLKATMDNIKQRTVVYEHKNTPMAHINFKLTAEPLASM